VNVVGRGDSESRPPFTVAISVLAIVIVTGMAWHCAERGQTESIWIVMERKSAGESQGEGTFQWCMCRLLSVWSRGAYVNDASSANNYK
jgi:hypothetical protein